MDDENVTYRVGALNDPHNVGKSASNYELARFAGRDLDRTECLVLEKTSWEKRDGKMRPAWTVIMDAESRPGEWKLGEAVSRA